jgi:hypothetical protein
MATCKPHRADVVATCAACAQGMCLGCIEHEQDSLALCAACSKEAFTGVTGAGAAAVAIVAFADLGVSALGATFMRGAPSAVGLAALSAVFLTRVLPLVRGVARSGTRLRGR